MTDAPDTKAGLDIRSNENRFSVTVEVGDLTLCLADGTYGRPGYVRGNVSRRDRALVVALLKEAIKEIDPDGEA